MGRVSVAFFTTGEIMGEIMGEATMEDVELLNYCNIVNPECGNCKMYDECSAFKEKFGIYPCSAILVKEE